MNRSLRDSGRRSKVCRRRRRMSYQGMVSVDDRCQ